MKIIGKFHLKYTIETSTYKLTPAESLHSMDTN